MKQLTKTVQPTWCCICLIFLVLQLNCSQKFLLLRWQIALRKGKKKQKKSLESQAFHGYKNICACVINLPPQGRHLKIETLGKQPVLCLLLQVTEETSRDENLCGTNCSVAPARVHVLVTHREHWNSQGKQYREDQWTYSWCLVLLSVSKGRKTYFYL